MLPQEGSRMSLIADLKSLEPSQRNAIWASYLGWTLDAFDFFLMVFMLSAIAKEFGTDVKAVAAGRVPDARRAPDRRVRLRLARRAFRSPAGADGRHHPFLGVRVRVGFRADPDQPACTALPLRDRHGRRMGPRREPGHGIDPAEASRARLRAAAERLSVGLFCRQPRLLPAVRPDRLARHVHDRHCARACS